MTKQNAKELGVRFGVDDPRLASPPRYNIAPSQFVPIVRMHEEGEREMTLLHWGLIPHWANDPSFGRRMINARAESVTERPVYRHAFAERRCLVLADGFYEWKALSREDAKENAKKGAKGKERKVRQPYYIHRKDGDVFAFAGLWERWSDKDQGVELESFSIITTTPNELLEPIHNRMPVILGEDEYDRWLDPEEPEPEKLLSPYSAEEFEATPVSTWVNSPTRDDPKCVEPQVK